MPISCACVSSCDNTTDFPGAIRIIQTQGLAGHKDSGDAPDLHMAGRAGAAQNGLWRGRCQGSRLGTDGRVAWSFSACLCYGGIRVQTLESQMSKCELTSVHDCQNASRVQARCKQPSQSLCQTLGCYPWLQLRHVPC